MPILLPVPYISQWGASANRVRSDCGVASVLMVGRYYGKMGQETVDSLSADTTLPKADVGLMPQALVTLGLRHGLYLETRSGVTLADIQAEIRAGRPNIPLVHYRFITGRLDQADNNAATDGHFFVVVGFDDTHVVVNDPDYWFPHEDEGDDILIPVAEIERAMAGFGNQCVFVKERQDVTLGEQIEAISNQIQVLAEQAKTLARQIPEEVPPAPRFAKANAPAGNLNVRAGMSTSTAIVKNVPNGTLFEVIPTSSPDWSQITSDAWKGNYVWTAFLDFQ